MAKKNVVRVTINERSAKEDASNDNSSGHKQTDTHTSRRTGRHTRTNTPMCHVSA